MKFKLAVEKTTDIIFVEEIVNIQIFISPVFAGTRGMQKSVSSRPS
jgi:hypothetical protein